MFLLAVIGGVGFLIYEMIQGRIDTSHDAQVELTDDLRKTYEQRLSDAKAMIESQKDKDRDWQAYWHAGVAAQNLGKYGEAEKYYTAFTKHFPSDHKVLANYANLLGKTGRYKEAEAIYVKLLSESLVEEDLRDYIDILKVQNTDGSRDADIVAALENAITSFGQTPYIMQTLADWYEAHGQCTLAIDHYKVLMSIVSADRKDQIQSDMDRVQATCTNK